MQVNKLLKGLLIVVPTMTMMACSSSSSVDEQAGTNTTQAATETSSANVQTGTATRVRSPEEIMQEDKAALQSEQVVYFVFDRSSIRSQDFAILDKHAAFLVKNPSQSVTIEGHCDERGTPEYNIALGERRAKSVQTYLQNAGVSASQISVVSYGEEKPVDASHNEAAFDKNRRGVLVYR